MYGRGATTGLLVGFFCSPTHAPSDAWLLEQERGERVWESWHLPVSGGGQALEPR